ncbi:hypothetical protein D3C72_626830 [compost metagenome]
MKINLLGLLFLAIVINSCDRIRSTTNRSIKEFKEVVSNESDKLVDKVIPTFDSYKSDTEFNKKRFKNFLQIELTSDVKNIYCYADEMGIDQNYQFSFNCDTSTVIRILQKHQLRLDTATSYGFSAELQKEFVWWKCNDIKKLPMYSWKGDNEYYKYFWYNQKTRKAYYLDFDL